MPFHHIFPLCGRKAYKTINLHLQETDEYKNFEIKIDESKAKYARPVAAGSGKKDELWPVHSSLGLLSANGCLLA